MKEQFYQIIDDAGDVALDALKILKDEENESEETQEEKKQEEK